MNLDNQQIPDNQHKKTASALRRYRVTVSRQDLRMGDYRAAKRTKGDMTTMEDVYWEGFFRPAVALLSKMLEALSSKGQGGGE